MKYKVGDKFLLEVHVAKVDENNKYNCPYRIYTEHFIPGNWSERVLDELRRPDDMTAEEAWEIAKKIVYLYFQDPNEEFSDTYTSSYDLLAELTPQQAKAKIEAWEANKEIKVGDVVETEDGTKAVVMDIQRQTFGVFTEDGCVEEWYKSKTVKTGRHIDIQNILRHIGGAE